MQQVQRNEGNVDAWRLLGTVHAENDDDTQAIAAMARALKADPTNAEVSAACLFAQLATCGTLEHVSQPQLCTLGALDGCKGALTQNSVTLLAFGSG